MKTKHIFIAALLLMTIPLISFNYIGKPSGPHGGIVKPAGDSNYTIELKNSSPNLYAFLLDSKFKPINNKGIKCEGKFILADSTYTVIPFKPFWEDGFTMKLGTMRFNTCRVSFTVSGKTVSAMFENENLIANQKH